MITFNRILIGLKLEETPEEKALFEKLSFLKSAHIELIHISRLNDFKPKTIHISSLPDSELKVFIEHEVLLKIKDIEEQFRSGGHEGQIKYRCLFSSHPAEEFCRYAELMKAQLIILFPDRSGHVFESFIHHLFQHSKVPLLILRN